MSDLLTIPMSDDYETTLSTSWNGATGSVAVNSTPDGTIPASKFSYIVVNPGESNMQVAKIDGWNAGAKTFNVTSIAVPKGQGGNYSATNHAAGAVVRFSNNYAFWNDIMTAVNSKADTTALNAKVGDFVFTGSKAVTPAPMTFQDSETAAITLKELATGAPADQYVAVSPTDTTVGHLNDKLTAGDGIKKTIINPGADEEIDLDIDVADTTTFVKTSSGATDENKIPVLDAAGQMPTGFIALASDAEATAGVLTTKPITPKQYKDNLYQALFSFTPSDNLRISADTVRTTTSGSMVELKRITVYGPGTVRIKFDLAQQDNVSTADGRIYKNGVAAGTTRTTTSSTYTTYSQDLACEQRDYFSIYASRGGGTAQIRNFRIYYDYVSNNGAVVNTD